MTIDRLSWDSDFFGRNIGRWRMDGPLPSEHPDPEDFDLIYVECKPTDGSILSSPNWFDAGQKVTFSCPTLTTPAAKGITRILEPSSELEALVWMSGQQSRYRLDPRFTEGDFKRLYSRWMNACLEGQWDAILLGHHRHGALTGFVTVESMTDHARIGLIAVHPAHRGRGIAGQLVASAKAEAHRKGQGELRVSTQGTNHAAIAAYLKGGFQPHQTIQQYHWWTQEAP